MLRVVVPTVYCRDPLEEMFGSSRYCHPPSAVPCTRMNSLMAFPTLAALAEAMVATERSSDDKEDNTCSCKKETRDQSDKDKRQSSEAKPVESVKPTSTEQTQNNSSSSSSTSKKTSSEVEKKPEAVTVLVERQGDKDSDRFKVSLNLKSFQPENIEVKRVGNELKIHAKQEVEGFGVIFHREIQRSYHLPEDIDVESLKSTLSTAGVLIVEAQHKPKDSDDGRQQSSENQAEATDVKESSNEEASDDESTGSEDTEVTELPQEEFSFDEPLNGSTTVESAEEDPNDRPKDGQDQKDE